MMYKVFYTELKNAHTKMEGCNYKPVVSDCPEDAICKCRKYLEEEGLKLADFTYYATVFDENCFYAVVEDTSEVFSTGNKFNSLYEALDFAASNGYNYVAEVVFDDVEEIIDIEELEDDFDEDDLEDFAEVYTTDSHNLVLVVEDKNSFLALENLETGTCHIFDVVVSKKQISSTKRKFVKSGLHRSEDCPMWELVECVECDTKSIA